MSHTELCVLAALCENILEIELDNVISQRTSEKQGVTQSFAALRLCVKV